MNLTFKEFKDIFEEKFIAPAYQEWRIEGGTGKDVVGRNFENFNRIIYDLYEIPLIDKKSKILGTNYNPDIAVGYDSNDVIIIEEDKGHYLDICFFDRGMMNGAKIFKKCIQENKNLPYFVISCATTYSKYDEIFKEDVGLFDQEIAMLLKEYTLHFPLCTHDRVYDGYFKTKANPFKLDEKLVEERLNFLYRIKRGMKPKV